jgi:hypothetical protein
LHITSLRRGPDGDPKSPDAANFDESKVSPHPRLPDPLVLKDGKKAKTAQMWWKRRRPEIVEGFDREVCGRVPNITPKVTWQVTGTTKEISGDVLVLTKNLVGHVDNSSYPLITVDIQLTLTTPAEAAAGPVPVIMEFGLSPEAMAALRKRFSDAQWAAFACRPAMDHRGSSKWTAKGWGSKLLGKKDVGITEMPPMETALISGDIAFRQHSGGHTTGPNWPTFLTFASRYLSAPHSAHE